ncbi:MAG: CvpA family protein [Peptococcaceae bacterium]|nr:CvpA family protein [Peptococcaceae bacterium]
MNFLDLVIVGLLLLGGLNGYRKGLIKSVVGIVSSFVSILVALATYKIITPMLHSKLGISKLVQKIVNHNSALPVTGVQPLQGNGLSQVAGNTSYLPQNLLSGFNSLFVNFMNSALGKTVHSTQDAMVQYISIVVVSIIAFLIIFVLVNWALRALGTLITKAFDHTFLGSLNHSGGFIIGVAGSVLILSITFAFFLPLVALYVNSSSVTGLIKHSILLPQLNQIYAFLTSTLSRIFG